MFRTFFNIAIAALFSYVTVGFDAAVFDWSVVFLLAYIAFNTSDLVRKGERNE